MNTTISRAALSNANARRNGHSVCRRLAYRIPARLTYEFDSTLMSRLIEAGAVIELGPQFGDLGYFRLFLRGQVVGILRCEKFQGIAFNHWFWSCDASFKDVSHDMLALDMCCRLNK